MKQRYIPVKIVLGIVSITHVVIGIVGMIPPIPIGIALAFYGATDLDISIQFKHVLQMYGAYMFTIGIMAALAAWNPLKNKAIIYGICILFFVRVLQRLFFFQEADETFGISAPYYWIQTAVFLLIALFLILFRPKGNDIIKS